MNKRVNRLVSAGVPIASAFQAVVEEVIDNGSAGFDALNKRVQQVMYLKEKKILADWDTWDEFTDDIISQISEVDEDAKPALIASGNRWTAPGFVRGQEYVAIDSPRITYTVWDERTRQDRDLQARMQMDFNRFIGDIQVIVERYPDMPERYRSQIQHAVGTFQKMARELAGFDSDLGVDLTAERIIAPRPEVVRGNEKWRVLTGCDMKYPIKELTIERVKAMPPGTEFNLKGLTLLIAKLLAEIEKPLPEQLGEVKSSTVRQALQGKDAEGTGGLIGDAQITRLNPSTFRRL